MAELDTRAIKKALQQPKSTSPWFACAVAIFCIFTISLIAIAMTYRWGLDKANQVDDLRQESVCRSELAAQTDVAQGDFLADLGRVNLSTARALAALGRSDDAGVADLVQQLTDNTNALDRTLAAYRVQIQARAKTAETCNRK